MDTQQAEQAPIVKFWCDQIHAYEKKAKTWEARSKKIIKRYKDDRSESARNVSRFNILWSNVQTLHPAIYAQPPKPNVDRRFQDDDELGTTVAQVLERAVSYYINDDFDDVMNQVVLDRLLPGRGVAWVRYVPNFIDETVEGSEEVKQEGAQVTDDIMLGDEAKPPQELYSEDVVVDYVNWQDFGHSVARTWQEVRGVWRRVYLNRKELEGRFGAEKAAKVPMDANELGKGTRDDDEADAALGKRGTVYEIWDRVLKKAIWIVKTLDEPLDERDDPLKLKHFFPCPKPIFSTLANDELIPVPDYLIYQDQAQELDLLTGRIDALSKALKVVGVYDSSAEGVQRMLSENVDNQLIPVQNWAMFAEKGGLKGVVDYFPVEQVAKVLIELYGARERVKQDIYEITGISDIVRGATNANETATAQQLKGQFATLRLDNMQKDAARFSRDLVRIMAEIISEHFSLETLKEISGIKLMSAQEKQQIMAQMQQAQMVAQQTQQPPPPLPEEQQELLAKPTWEEVEQVLRTEGLRCFKIDIETDSTIKADQDAEKTARTEFLTAAGSFIQQAAQIPDPKLQPLLMEMLMFGVRGFKVGREMESTFKVAMDKIRQQADAPQPTVDPAAEAQKQEMALKERELGFKEQESERKFNLEEQKIDVERQRNRIDGKSKVTPDIALTDNDLNPEGSPLLALLQQMQQQAAATQQGLMLLAQAQSQGTQAIVEAITRPKQVIRDQQGKIAEVV